MMMFRRNLLCCLPMARARPALARPAQAEPAPVQIYAAMTFRPALEHVVAAYREAGGGAAVAIYAPTPVLIRQLAGGAPADILLTGDLAWMDEAARQALVQPETRSNLIANDLVLAAPAGTQTAATITRTFALDALLNGGRLAMCDPDHDPAGRYAKQTLQSLGFWQAVEPHIAIAESSPAAVVLVDHHEVAAAICFVTDLHGDAQAVAVGTFPSDSHAPIIYPVALANPTRNPLASSALAFLRSAEALKIFFSFGYTPAI
ncbi:MAG: molybdate ABC transporter substrate-binding protein [Rhodopila sp.]|jgi:molybdate transport system substrate-binding protein